MNNKLEVIGIDHGWSMMKTISQVFVTGVKEITTSQKTHIVPGALVSRAGIAQAHHQPCVAALPEKHTPHAPVKSMVGRKHSPDHYSTK